MHNSWFVSEWRWSCCFLRTHDMAWTHHTIKLSVYKFCVGVIKFASFQSGCLEDVLTDTWPSSYRSQWPGFPGTLLVWLREPLWEVSSSHCCSVSPFLQATVSGIIYLWQWSCLECVCVYVCLRLSVCASGCVFVYVGPPVSLRWLGACRRVSHGCPKDNPQSRLQRNEQRRWMFSEHRRISLQLPVLALDWFAESQSLDVNIKPANGFNLNMLLINAPQSINVKILWKP